MKLIITKERGQVFCKVSDFTDMYGKYHERPSPLHWCSKNLQKEIKEILINIVTQRFDNI